MSGHGTGGVYSYDDHTTMRPVHGQADADDDYVPILTKTRRKIEDFNVVMANPTYEGHGFLNFVATYHDHTENFDDSSRAWIRQIGKRFLSTIGGLTTASNDQRTVCRALKDGIDSYRMNGIMPHKYAYNNGVGPGTGAGDGGAYGVGSQSSPGGYTEGHDDPWLYPMGPGPGGDYGNGQRCGAAMYENFGDWFLRPAQTYAAFDRWRHQTPALATAATAGWGTVDGDGTASNCDIATTDENGWCLTSFESYNYWAFILSEGYNPIDGVDEVASVDYLSPHELWRNGSLHYDRRGTVNADADGIPGSSGRGFAISSFPHNELGKDFRFNIRTLHNMGNGVAKQYYQIANIKRGNGLEYNQSVGTANTLMTSNLRTSETVWSYYFYAVDTIKIAFPEFVARVNHCDKHTHRNTSHCTVKTDIPTGNGNPRHADDAENGPNEPSAYPGYLDGHPKYHLGFQDIIIDGVTMKKTDNQYDSRVTTSSRTEDSGAGNWHKQYHNARGLRGDDHTRASLHYYDIEFANEDRSLDPDNYDSDTNRMCGTDMSKLYLGKTMIFYDGSGTTGVKSDAGNKDQFQGYTDSYQPLKPCASWCSLDKFATSGILSGAGVDPSKQNYDSTSSTLNGMSSTVPANEDFSEFGGICGRVLRIDGLLQTYDELHNRQYGTIQEIWVQLQYAYQETMDNSERVGSAADAAQRVVQSPFPNVFFSAPEVVDIRGFCPSSNMKCRGYMTDQNQPYGGSRVHVERVHWNDSATRSTDARNGFGANQVTVRFIK